MKQDDLQSIIEAIAGNDVSVPTLGEDLCIASDGERWSVTYRDYEGHFYSEDAACVQALSLVIRDLEGSPT